MSFNRHEIAKTPSSVAIDLMREHDISKDMAIKCVMENDDIVLPMLRKGEKTIAEISDLVYISSTRLIADGNLDLPVFTYITIGEMLNNDDWEIY